MTEVPASAVPPGAWGISGYAYTPEEISEADPFDGRGVRLEGPPGRVLEISDIEQATGLGQIIIFFTSGPAWVRLEPGYSAEGVRASWQAWLTREEVTDSP